jgi:hypothetical protein
VDSQVEALGRTGPNLQCLVSDNDWYRSIQVQAVDRGADPQMIGVKRDLDRQPSDNSRSLWWMLAT